MTTRRDRDDAGRPRQQRPRDTLGRPLPYGDAGVEPLPEEALPPSETIDTARALVREGRPFAVHEVLEARWKAGPDWERDFCQGLAQLCVGLTHAARGNTVGADRLLERGAERLDAHAAGGGPRYGLDLVATLPCARGQAAAQASTQDQGTAAGPYWPVRPSMHSRSKSACPACLAYSSTRCTTMSRASTSSSSDTTTGTIGAHTTRGCRGVTARPARRRSPPPSAPAAGGRWGTTASTRIPS